MDGNFVDNSIDELIESASILPQAVRDETDYQKPINLLNRYDAFSLRIKFNRDLDPNSVNVENTVVTQGRRQVGTKVRYDKNRKSIIISPRGKYLRDTLYIMKISGKIMSEKGRSLRRHRFLAFKQDGKTLSFYKGFTGKMKEPPEELLVQHSITLPAFFVISTLVLIFSYFAQSKAGMILGTMMVLLTTAAAFIDSVSDFGKSHKEYNFGAKLYNDRYYYEAIESFEHALHLNPDNEFAQYGLEAAITRCTAPSKPQGARGGRNGK